LLTTTNQSINLFAHKQGQDNVSANCRIELY